MKTLNVIVDGKEELIRFTLKTMPNGEHTFSVETSIPNLEIFPFAVGNNGANFLSTNKEEDEMKRQIISQIDKHISASKKK